jgi:hypothetical protein
MKVKWQIFFMISLLIEMILLTVVQVIVQAILLEIQKKHLQIFIQSK